LGRFCIRPTATAVLLLVAQVKKVKTEYLKDPAFTFENIKTISTAGAGEGCRISLVLHPDIVFWLANCWSRSHT
jgi:hypothetical protein